MSLNQLRHASWIRTALRVLVLCFALGTLAHAGHTHELSKVSATHYNCDYCTSFAGLIDTPVDTAIAVHQPITDLLIAAPHHRIFTTRPVGVAQARAPPNC
jgi:hypothetical protein